MLNFAKRLFPINRSLTGPGNRKTLGLIKKVVKKLKIKSFTSGQKVYDWTIPLEWSISDAFIIAPNNKKICDFKKNNLHVIGYSKAVKKKIDLKTLKKNLHFSKKIKSAIPYVTSYYKKRWGFCISYNQFLKLKKGIYKIFIKSHFKKGKLNYGEALLKGKSSREVLISTYICHPSMANNEISGPTLSSYLYKWLSLKKRKYTYRFIFIPETIGSIAYIKKNYKKLKKNTFAGYNLTCIGDERSYSYIPSKYKNSVSDKVYFKAIKLKKIRSKIYSWSKRGSDERQFCSPGVDLPIGTIMRSKFGDYKEYHTSDDQIGKTVTSKGLVTSLNLVKRCINLIEANDYPVSIKLCEPFLTKYNMYNTLSDINQKKNNLGYTDVLTWCDGTNNIDDISELSQISKKVVKKIISILINKKLVRI